MLRWNDEAAMARRGGPVVILLLVFALYGVTIGGGFVWDDVDYIQNNSYVRHLEDWSKYFTDARATSHSANRTVYRPLTTLAYALTHVAFGERPAGYHLLNLLLHAGNGILLALLLSRLARNELLGWSAGVVFACHPAASEAVAWVKGCPDLLALFWSLAALLCYLRAREGAPAWHGASLAAYALALLSKESAAAYPAVWVLLAVSRRHAKVSPERSRWGRQETAHLAALLLVSVAYLVARGAVVGRLDQRTDFLTGSFWQLQLLMLGAFTKYVLLALCPLKLTVDYYDLAEFPHTWHEPAALAGAALMLLLAAAAVRLCRKGWWLPAWGIGWFVAGLLPVWNLVPLVLIMAERFLYLSLPGAVLALLCLLHGALQRHWPAERAGRPARAYLLICLLLLVPLAWRTEERAWDWSSERALWQAEADQGAASPFVAVGLASSLLRESVAPETVRRAEALLLGALDRDPGNADVRKGLATLYWRAGLPRQAEAMLEAIVAAGNVRDIRKTGAATALGGIAERRGDDVLAETRYRRALALVPDDPLATARLATLLERTGRTEEAARLFDALLRADPHSEPAHLSLGRRALAASDLDAAERHFADVVQQHPGDLDALAGLAETLARDGRLEAACRLVRRVGPAHSGELRARLAPLLVGCPDGASR